MNSQIKTLPKSRIELTITVSYSDYQKAEKKALQKLNQNIKVDGFRSGHIPETVIRQQVGDQTVADVTLEEVLPTSYTQAVKENQLQVIGRPQVQIKTPVKNEGDSLVYTAQVDVMPEIKLGNYKKIKIKKEQTKLDPKEVDATIDMIMQRFATWKDVKRKAKKGDRVEADFEGFDEKGKSIKNTASKNHPIVIGQGSMIPGFEDAIIGMSVNEEKEFDITFPKEYHAKEMQGRKITFKLTVKRLEEREDQVLDAAMVKQITGQEQSPEEFKKRVEEDLKKENESKQQQKHDNRVVQEIIKIVDVELPEALIKEELNMIQQEQQDRIERQGMTWEQYLSHIKKTQEDFEKDHQKAAEERLKARLGTSEIIQKEGLKPTDQEITEKVDEAVSQYPKDKEASVREYYKKGSEGYSRLVNNLSADKLIKMFTA